MATIKIGKRILGANASPYLAAEAGINHNGELEKAFQMIEAAKNAGVDAVKFQTFKAEEFITDTSLKFTYKSQGKEVTESQLEMFRRYEFSKDEWHKIKIKCDDEGITFLSTPQNRSDLDLLLELGIDAVKIGSDDFTNIPLLKSYASTGLPLIVSCGMANLEEVQQSLTAIGAFEGYPVVLLVCTSQYPTPPSDVNLRKFETLRNSFPKIPLGFSDHTQGPLASSLAVSFGACFFEKHFTLSHDLPGPDHWFSEDPESLKAWASSIRTAHAMMGSSEVRATEAEEAMKTMARRSIVTLADIDAGTILDLKNIGLRRPGTGLPPSLFESVLGQRVIRRIPKGTLLKPDDFR